MNNMEKQQYHCPKCGAYYEATPSPNESVKQEVIEKECLYHALFPIF